MFEQIDFTSLKEILSAAKDLLLIAVAVVTSIISIKSYKNARLALAQPLRTEVVKRQVDLLTELLDITSSDKLKFMTMLDFSNIFNLNMKICLEEVGCTVEMSNDSGDKSSSAFKIVAEDHEPLEQYYFDNLRSESRASFQERRRVSATEGSFKVQLIHLTEQHVSLIRKLDSISNSPYLPLEIKSELDTLLETINYNLEKPMKEKIEESVCLMMSEGFDQSRFSFTDQYNEFNHDAIDFSLHSNELIRKVREVLKVDEKW